MRLLVIAVAALTAALGTALSAHAAAPPRVALVHATLSPGETLRAWVTCPAGTGAGDLQSPVTPYTALDPKSDGRWFGASKVAAGAAPGSYQLRVRCTAGPGSPYATSTIAFRVSAAQRWTAVSNTAMSITGDVTATRRRYASRTDGPYRLRSSKTSDTPNSTASSRTTIRS